MSSHEQKGAMGDKAAGDNRAKQLNPNCAEFKPREKPFGGAEGMTKEGVDNRADQLNPNNPQTKGIFEMCLDDLGDFVQCAVCAACCYMCCKGPNPTTSTGIQQYHPPIIQQPGGHMYYPHPQQQQQQFPFQYPPPYGPGYNFPQQHQPNSLMKGGDPFLAYPQQATAPQGPPPPYPYQQQPPPQYSALPQKF